LLANLTELAYPTFVLNSVWSNRSMTGSESSVTLRLYASNDKGPSGVVSISSSLTIAARSDHDRSWSGGQSSSIGRSSTASALFNAAPHFWLLLLIALIGSAILWALFTTGLLLTITIVRRRLASSNRTNDIATPNRVTSNAIAAGRIPMHFAARANTSNGASPIRVYRPYNVPLTMTAKCRPVTLLPIKRAPDLLPPPHLMCNNGSDVKLPLSLLPLPP
jgi:hypothetical protein